MCRHVFSGLLMLALALQAHAQGQTAATPPAGPAVIEQAAPDEIPTRPRVITSLDMLITDEVRAAMGEAKTFEDPIARGRVQKALRAVAASATLDLAAPVGEVRVDTSASDGPTWGCFFQFFGLVKRLGHSVQINNGEMPVVIAYATAPALRDDSGIGSRAATLWGGFGTDDESLATWASELKAGDPVHIRARISTISIERMPRYSSFDDEDLFPPAASGTTKWSIVIIVKGEPEMSRPKHADQPAEPTEPKLGNAPSDDDAE